MVGFGIVSIADGADRTMSIHPKHREWIEARGLDPVLAEKFGLHTHRDSRGAWLRIPYREAGETVNHKWRLTTEKQHSMDGTGSPLTLWNVDCLSDPAVKEGRAPVVITEGEWDALAAIQAGFQYAVSVPNGAPGTPTENLETAARYDWIDRHAETLAGVKEFVIAADADPAGYNLASDLVALLGADRCRFIEYPFPCKDLNEVLTEYGAERVVHCISTARPYPVKGLYTIDDFPERGEVRSYPVGIPEISDLIAIVPGTLTVVTGYANMGKSTMMNQIVGYALSNHFPVCVASFETEVKPILRNGIKCAILGCGNHELHKHDKPELDELLRKRLTIISQQVDDDIAMDVDDFLGLARIAVVRHGAKMIVLDPWNELEHKRRRDESETEYIGRAIRAIKRFAKINDVAFWIVAHPTKPQEGRGKIPGLYDISGSANWANKADYGITYHRPKFDQNLAKSVVNTVRMGLPGRRAEVELSFDYRTSRFAPA